MDFRSLSPPSLLSADCHNSLEVGFRSPLFNLSVINPGLNQRSSIPLIRTSFSSPYCRIAYLSEERKASLEFSPSFGSVPLNLTVHAADQLRASFSFLHTIPMLDSIDSDVSVRVKYDLLAAKATFGLISHVRHAILDSSLGVRVAVRDLISIPSVRLAATFGASGAHWGMEIALDRRGLVDHVNYLIVYQDSIFGLRGKWMPITRVLKSSVTVALKKLEVVFGRHASPRGVEWSINGKIKGGCWTAEFRRHSAGKLLCLGEWGSSWGKLAVWSGVDVTKPREKMLFGAKLILDLQ
jgi:hypothetical protein